MKTRNAALVLTLTGLSAMGMPGCSHDVPVATKNPIVGTWLVKDPDAPFPYHMYVFNSDGTMQQANPDAGDTHSSDSDGKGIWVVDGGAVKGKWVEVVADRATHKFTGRTEVSFSVTVAADKFVGTETAISYDAAGTLMGGPTSPGALEGKRVTLP